MKNSFNSGNLTVLYLKYSCIYSLVKVLNRKAEQSARPQTANGANKRLVLHVRLRCGSMSITTPVSLLRNDFDVRSVLQGQVSLTAVNQVFCNS